MMNNFCRLWIFQSNRFLNNEEKQNISDIISKFLASWAAHGADLKSELRIIEDKFIVIMVDEDQTRATGCSLDKLNQCMREIDHIYHLELLNRLWVSFEDTNGNINTIPISSFKEKIKSEEITPNTYVYNLSVNTPKEFEEKFKQPLKNSWAKIYMKL